MSSLIWKIKQWFRQLMPIVMIAGLFYGGYTLAMKGYFGRSVGRSVYQLTRPLKRLPVFGSLFKTRRSSVARGRHHRRHRARHHRRYRRYR